MSLLVHEIYSSIQGETRHAGRLCTLVRLTGCDLRCRYCDTEYAFVGGRTVALDELLGEIEALGQRLVLLTGGEPLLQRELPELATRLVARGFEVMVETGGHRDTAVLPAEASVILDVKTPDSGESERMMWSNLERLRPRDAAKFVVCSRADYEWSRRIIEEHRLGERTEVLLAPSFGVVAARDLVAWMLEDRLRARLNLQLHKYVWEPETRGV